MDLPLRVALPPLLRLLRRTSTILAIRRHGRVSLPASGRRLSRLLLARKTLEQDRKVSRFVGFGRWVVQQDAGPGTRLAGDLGGGAERKAGFELVGGGGEEEEGLCVDGNGSC